MIQLIHNPRCSKSRAVLAIAEAAAIRLDEPLQVIDYVREPLPLAALQQLQAQLDLPARALLREGDDAFAALGLDAAALADAAVLQLLAAHPALLQRPVLVRGGKAVIGRPPEAVLDILR